MAFLVRKGLSLSRRYGLKATICLIAIGLIGCTTIKQEEAINPITLSVDAPDFKIPAYERKFKPRAITYPNEHVKRAHDGSVQIIRYKSIDQDGKKIISKLIGRGTGVVHVDYSKKEIWVWTCHHVIDEKIGKLAILFKESAFSDTGYFYDAEVEAVSTMLDLALLKITVKDDKHILNFTSIDFQVGELPEIGAPVFHFGNFNSRLMDGVENFTYGNISRYYDGPRLIPRIETTSKTYFGSSGGGLFLAEDGRCLGLASTITDSGLGMYVPYYEIRAWAKAAGYPGAIN